MAYKTVLTVLTESTGKGPLLRQAQNFASQRDAHLDVLCVGVDRSQTGYYYGGATAMILQEAIGRATDEAQALEAVARAECDKYDGRWAVDRAVAQMVDLGRHVALRARFSDLVVLSKPYNKDSGSELEAITEGALFAGQAPVLVLPNESEVSERPSRIIVAWNESAEALGAIRAALPFLIAADHVHVVVIDPPQHGPDRSDPGGMLSQYLARHGVRAEIDVLAKSMPRVSDILLRHADDLKADMVVMGAYGHSRFRESILGGATRNMLEQADVPLLLAH